MIGTVERRLADATSDPFAHDRMRIDDSGKIDPTIALFEQAVEAHSKRLLTIARAIIGYRGSPEDVVQQAMMNLYRHRQRYDWREPGGLMRRAVVNESLRLLRQPRMSMVADDHPGRSQTPPGEIIANETVQQVRRAIERLPEHFRAALVLCEYENLSYAQIAEALNASIPQVKTWLHRGRKQLAQMLKGYVEGERERVENRKL
ncbi:MAG: RNA polymerase sigma factor [Phycisphaerales bacterium]|jgi:RNA polymerase sigma-70 factor (ECF subfamily)|nr:RNA polymerase sigma factor [Phycisphaerales bacterium]